MKYKNSFIENNFSWNFLYAAEYVLIYIILVRHFESDIDFVILLVIFSISDGIEWIISKFVSFTDYMKLKTNCLMNFFLAGLYYWIFHGLILQEIILFFLFYLVDYILSYLNSLKQLD